MRTLLLRCLLVNMLALAASFAIAKYPKNQGFTITTSDRTHYVDGGVFLGTLLISVFDIAMGIYLATHLWRPR